MNFLKTLRHGIVYVLVMGIYHLLRLFPRSGVTAIARLAAFGAYYFYPPFRKVVAANIVVAMPELPPEEVRRISRRSFDHLMLNLLEFLWLNGRPERIRRCYFLPPEVETRLRQLTAEGGRIIFVNPHLGSWEGSGVMAPFYAGVQMAAIAKPLRNPLLNRAFNASGREKVPGLKIIFSVGAMRAAVKALRSGLSLGTLIDQNTKGRAGGVFVDFFGLPVPSSAAPAVLKRLCDVEGIPATIVYGTSVRESDGRITAHMELLPRPFGEYADERAVLQELMNMSEKYIRRYPEQYLWLYRRFQHIPADCPAELRKRYPWYAEPVRPSFYRRGAARRTDPA